MKLGIGTAMSKSPGAATFETGPAYEYSFAMDFSKLVPNETLDAGNTTDSFPGINQTGRIDASNDNAALYNRAGGTGFRLENKSSGQDLKQIGFPNIVSGASDADEALIKSSFTSHSQDGMPDGSLNNEFHYFSMVVTFNSTLHAEHASNPGLDAKSINTTGTMYIEDSDGKSYGGHNFEGDKGLGKDYPRYINGVDISVGFSDTVRNVKSGMILSGQAGFDAQFDTPMTLTWDMNDAISTPFPTDAAGIDPAEIRFFHDTAGFSSTTFHGFIFSSSPPGEITLPIHTSRPAAGFA